MTLILVAVDESDASIAAAHEARQLFGPDADYLAVNVATTAPAWTSSTVMFGAVYAFPTASTYPLVDDVVAIPGSEPAENARQNARELAAEAGIIGPDTVGDVGDPADAILSAAEAHAADVIVIGASSKGWWQRLFEGSVGERVTKRSPRPVLIAGQSARHHEDT